TPLLHLIPVHDHSTKGRNPLISDNIIPIRPKMLIIINMVSFCIIDIFGISYLNEITESRNNKKNRALI
ncbi:MAG: hypothetical protein AAB267_03860, partial [Candidatus Desantisbacteria bacterium]